MWGTCVRDPDVPGLQGGEVKGKRQPRLGGQVEISSRERKGGSLGVSTGLCSPWAARGRSVTCMNPPRTGLQGSWEAERGLWGNSAPTSFHDNFSLCPRSPVPQAWCSRPPGLCSCESLCWGPSLLPASVPPLHKGRQSSRQRGQKTGNDGADSTQCLAGHLAFLISPSSSPPRRGMLIILTQQVLKLRL